MATCDDLYRKGFHINGVYDITINGEKFKAYCQFKKKKDEYNWLVNFLECEL